MEKIKILVECQTFRHHGQDTGIYGFDVQFKWGFESDTCIVTCGEKYYEDFEVFKERIIICSPSDRGEIQKVGWNSLRDCDMVEGCTYSTELHSWIVEYNGEFYAVFFDEAEKRGNVEYTINRLQEPKSKSDDDYSVKKGIERVNIENREELLDCVEKLINEYQKASIW